MVLSGPAASPTFSPATQAWLDNLDAIRKALPVDVPALTAKQLELLDAFSQREDRYMDRLLDGNVVLDICRSRP